MSGTLAKRKIASALLQKGFIERPGRSDHRVFLFLVGGKKTGTFTRMSHSSQKDIQRKLIGAMARQCHLTKAQFLDLVDCTMSKADYREHLEVSEML